MITPEKFRETLDGIIKTEQESLVRDGHLLHKLFLFRGDEIIICGIVDRVGGGMGPKIRQAIKATGGADAFIFAGEGWTITTNTDVRTKAEALDIAGQHRVHEQPDRRECLMIQAVHPDHREAFFQTFHRANGKEDGPIVLEQPHRQVNPHAEGGIIDAADVLRKFSA